MKELESQRECECMGYSYECWICLLAYSNGCVHKNRDGIQRTYGYLDFIHFTNSDVHLWRFALPGGNQKNVSWNRCTVQAVLADIRNSSEYGLLSTGNLLDDKEFLRRQK